jgi:DNA polymerase-3 subunit gamma/tau
LSKKIEETAQVINTPKPILETITEEPQATFNIPDLLGFWKKYLEHVKQNKPLSDSLILDREIKVEGTTIILPLDNVIQEDQLNVFKSDLLDFLRKNLNNSNISIQTELKNIDSETMIYTSKEKYQHLSLIYPMLDEIRIKLGLDFNG